MKCPICDNQTTTKGHEYIENEIIASRGYCEDKHHKYAYECFAGSHVEYIADFKYTYDSSESEQIKKLNKEMFNAVVDIERKKYQIRKDKHVINTINELDISNDEVRIIDNHYEKSDSLPFYSQNLDDINIQDGKEWLDEKDALVAIVCPSEGGIIGYTDKDYAGTIINILNLQKIKKNSK